MNMFFPKINLSLFFHEKAKSRNNPPPKKKQYKSKYMANTDPWIYQRWDQVPRRSKHPLLTGGHTHSEPIDGAIRRLFKICG